MGATPLLVVTDPALAAAIGRAMVYCVEDGDEWQSRVLMSTEMDAAARRFYDQAKKLFDLDSEIDEWVEDFPGDTEGPCTECDLYLYRDKQRDWHDEHGRVHMCQIVKREAEGT